MSRAKSKKRPRAERRELERSATKLSRERERLFALSEGGHPDRPIVVASASLVEPRALAQACPRCGSALSLLAHAAVTIGDSRLRRADLQCRGCSARLSSWFRLLPNALN